MLGTGAVASVATAYAGSVAALVPALGAPAARTAVLVGTFALLAWINARGVRQGARLIEVVSVAKLLPLLVLVGVAPSSSDPPTSPSRPCPPARLRARGDRADLRLHRRRERAGAERRGARPGAHRAPGARHRDDRRDAALPGVHVVAQGVLGGAGSRRPRTPRSPRRRRGDGPAGRYLLLVGATSRCSST
jgi:hypothetical protein